MFVVSKKVVGDTLKIAICDDDLVFGCQAKNMIKSIVEKINVSSSFAIFNSGSDLLNAGFFDIVFLDVEMAGLSGIETAENIRSLGYTSRIIFLTSHQKYVFSAFDVAASHYLLKPLEHNTLERVLTKITSELTLEKKRCYSVKFGKESHLIPFSQIKYVDVLGRKVSIHTQKDVFTFNARLDELEESFPSSFFRCHKSYLLNLGVVVGYNKDSASLEDGQCVPISRRKLAPFKTAFLEFLKKDGDW